MCYNKNMWSTIGMVYINEIRIEKIVKTANLSIIIDKCSTGNIFL